ncbi:ribosomal oxygenase 1-like [Penaeus japonicus]|uniref:ribosomal oxygenase 1-like n=1 Tax=Penaeus japonicus TaxID=27405 RepID=UPI001C70C843|nr:ribosomal oxygenase 1-like [Penaeus japonicus]XP_042856759.1 ribosomal oxygenase 1-like [Penaeus japonicus]XP_042856760.1 ribosomal oxygenase 1-like [Penaeus japonicus]XP_042856761.1 ribosomal oxygenase 1-like [Penaeus japonicus]XP_042856762.1 ribosomal oxygenase 1-like [Penaeus japonicus]XP_042856763.1 ribosomal oxygenase 1-like [Penaeus japonicus]
MKAPKDTVSAVAVYRGTMTRDGGKVKKNAKKKGSPVGQAATNNSKANGVKGKANGVKGKANGVKGKAKGGKKVAKWKMLYREADMLSKKVSYGRENQKAKLLKKAQEQQALEEKAKEKAAKQEETTVTNGKKVTKKKNKTSPEKTGKNSGKKENNTKKENKGKNVEGKKKKKKKEVEVAQQNGSLNGAIVMEELLPESDDENEMEVEALSGEDIGAKNTEDSREEGRESFHWIIHPYSEKDFFSKYWEQGPLHIKRESGYYESLFTTADLDKILHNNVVQYSKNLDITSYSNGKRETHNPIGQAHAPVVWDYYNNGCSVRMLNPQTFHARVWKLLATLQEYFNSFCGANVYLTPPDTQGFAPHWDDIEAFILQLEGKKRWRVYSPRTEDEVLPVDSSGNLDANEVGEPILDVTLEEGDLLYFPRGFIHQGHTVEGHHSLHITVSTYQKNTWGHFLQKMLPQAVSAAMAEDVEFRKGLPRNYLDCMGIANMDHNIAGREAFIKKVGEMVGRMLETAPIDAAVDQMGAGFMHDCLPPFLKAVDKSCSVYGGGEKWCKTKRRVVNRVELGPDTPVRLIRGNCLRVVVEADNVRLYHTLENSREYHAEDPQYLELVPESAPVVEALLHAYPKYITIENLPLEEESEKMAVVSGLWERGLLVTAQPLDACYDD